MGQPCSNWLHPEPTETPEEMNENGKKLLADTKLILNDEIDSIKKALEIRYTPTTQ